MNRAILVGRLTRDPDLRYTSNGLAVCNFNIAVNRPFKNQDGEQEADFIQGVCWRKQAENLANYMSKGSRIGVDGRIQTRNYEGDDGKRAYVTEVLAESIQFLESKGGSSSHSRSSQNNTRSSQQKQQDMQPVDIQDDDLPF